MPHASILRPLAIFVLAASFLTKSLAEEIDYAKEAAIEARLAKYLPRTLPKLQRRARVRVVIVGDEVSRFGFGPDEDPHQSWHYQLLDLLASKYYYGGGVRISGQKPKPAPPLPEPGAVIPPRILPPRGEVPPIPESILGAPEFLIRNFSRKGATAIQALQPLTTEAFDDRPDLVIWMYGLNDALQGVPVTAYRQALDEAIKHCKLHQADLLIAGPSLIFGDDLRSLPSTLEYAQAAQAAAANAGSLFLNMTAALGDVSCVVPAEPQQAFSSFLSAVKKAYSASPVPDLIHPSAIGHSLMAEAAWQQLLAAPLKPSISSRGSFTQLASLEKNDSKSSPNLEITLYQDSTPDRPATEVTDLMMTVLEQPGGWERSGETTFALKPFTERRTSRMPLEPTQEGNSFLPLGLTAVCPFVLHSPGRSQLLSINAFVLPIALELPVQRIEGVAGDILIDGTISNQVKDEFHATAEIEWLGKKTEMAIALEGHASKPLKFRLSLPEANSIHSELLVRLKAADRVYAFKRTIDATRNFLPEQKLTFAGAAPKSSLPNLSVKVDAFSLVSTFELPPAKQPGGSVSLMIDARDPAERGKLGFIENFNFNLPAADGPIVIKKVPAAVFGNGYDRELNPAHIRASLRTGTDGARLVEIAIPKVYFYLHQWSLADRGQNTLGFNASVQLPDLPAPLSLTNSKFSINDASSLGVLQLIPKSTGEWSVRIY